MHVDVTLFSIYAAATLVVWAGVGLWVWRTHRAAVQSPWRVAALILGVALLARVVLAVMLPPTLSDDIWRYIHDGRTLAAWESPYVHAPEQVMAAAEAAGQGEGASWLGLINHPHLATIYLPTSQAVFAGLACLDMLWQGAAFDPALASITFRLGFIAFDLGIVALLLWQLHVMGRSLWLAALYAWSPLAITEIGWSGHQDAIGIALMLGAAIFGSRVGMREHVARWPVHAVVAGVLLALAAAVKPIALPLALPLAWHARTNPRGIALAAGAACLTGVAVLLAVLAVPGGFGSLSDTMNAFVEHWRFNASLYGVIYDLSGSKPMTDAILAGVLIGVLLTATFAARDLWHAAAIYLLAGVLCSSTVHPWYLLWALAFLPLAFRPSLWLLSLTLPLAAYTAWLNPAGFEPYPWAWWLEYLPVYGVIGWELYRWLRHFLGYSGRAHLSCDVQP